MIEQEPLAKKQKTSPISTETEMMHIRLSNVSRSITSTKIQSMFSDIGLQAFGCRKTSKNVAFVDILASSSNDKENAIQLINNANIKGKADKIVFAELASAPKPFVPRPKLKTKQDDSMEAWEKLNDKVTPYWRHEYHEQLSIKQKEMHDILISGFHNQLKKDENLSFEFCDIVACPTDGLMGYRNKCEYSFGKDKNGKSSLGFMLGLYKHGDINVQEPSKCVHINLTNKILVEIIRSYLDSSSLPVYDRDTKTGFWRLAVIRTSHHSKQALLMIQTASLESEDKLKDEKFRFVKYIQEKASRENVQLTTVLWQVHNGCFNGVSETSDIQVVTGEGVILEHLVSRYPSNTSIDSDGGNTANQQRIYKFQVSARSFFQSNTIGAEVLYAKIHEWAMENETMGNKRKLVLDLCSGTGTIGITMTHLDGIEKIIGVEIVKEAVDDALFNAKLNNLHVGILEHSNKTEELEKDVGKSDFESNVKLEYVCDKVETALPEIMKLVPGMIEGKENDMEVLAILDPPRAGVHKNVIKAVRENEFIKRVIYVSCNPKAACINWLDLCRDSSDKRRFRGPPFRLRRAQPIDMFPHTNHCEMVLEFIRD